MLYSTNSCLHKPLCITTSLTFFFSCFFLPTVVQSQKWTTQVFWNSHGWGMTPQPKSKEALGSGRCCQWFRSVVGENPTQQWVRADPNVPVSKLLAKAVLFCAGEPVFPAWANRFWKTSGEAQMCLGTLWQWAGMESSSGKLFIVTQQRRN